jgi:hypothetical protein
MKNTELKQIYRNAGKITEEAMNLIDGIYTFGNVQSVLYTKLASYMEELETDLVNFTAAYRGVVDTFMNSAEQLMNHDDFSRLADIMNNNLESIYNKLSPEAVETLESIIRSEEDVSSAVREYGLVSEAISYLNKKSLSWREWAQVFEKIGFIYRHKKGTPNIGMAKDYGERYLMDNNRQKITFPPENKLKGSYFRWRKDFPDEDILEIASIITGD